VILLKHRLGLAYLLTFSIIEINLIYPGLFHLLRNRKTYLGIFVSDMLFAVYIILWADIGWPLEDNPLVSQLFIIGLYISGLLASTFFFIHDLIYQWKQEVSYEPLKFKSDEDRIKFEIEVEVYLSKKKLNKKKTVDSES
jgi:hypothetical protein